MLAVVGGHVFFRQSRAAVTVAASSTARRTLQSMTKLTTTTTKTTTKNTTMRNVTRGTIATPASLSLCSTRRVVHQQTGNAGVAAPHFGRNRKNTLAAQNDGTANAGAIDGDIDVEETADDLGVLDHEQSLRYDLAVAHRMTAKLNMDMLVWNHISARFQSGCLITPGRKLWSRMRPQDLVYASANVTADIIHSAIYEARPDIQAIIHLHTPAATTVSCLEGGFQPLTQDAAYFYGKVATYQWDGLSNDAAEGPALTQAVRHHPGCNTLLLHNHGFCCFGSSVAEAWMLAYYFERVCDVQLRVLSTGAKINVPDPLVMQTAAQTSYLPDFAPGMCEWDAICEEIGPSMENHRHHHNHLTHNISDSDDDDD